MSQLCINLLGLEHIIRVGRVLRILSETHSQSGVHDIVMWTLMSQKDGMMIGLLIKNFKNLHADDVLDKLIYDRGKYY